MTAKLTSRVTVRASRKQVFKYLADTRYHFLWNPHLQELQPQGELKEGSRYRTYSRLLGIEVQGHNKVTRLKPDRELQIENDAGTVHYKVNYSLHTADKTTQVVCTTEVTANGNAFAFTKPILRLLAQRELRSDLEALKLAAEQRLSL